MSEWISVGQALPFPMQNVLARWECNSGSIVLESYINTPDDENFDDIDKAYWCLGIDGFITDSILPAIRKIENKFEVTHWQPLRSLPED